MTAPLTAATPGPTFTVTPVRPGATPTHPATIPHRPGGTPNRPGGPVTAKPTPAIAKPAPHTAKPAPATAKPAPATAKPAPATAKPAPHTAKPAPNAAAVTTTATTTVARYTFNAGAGAGGRIADDSGRGSALALRGVHGGRVTFPGSAKDRDAAFPAACDKTATACPRALLEGTDDPDLDPGTRRFQWGASVLLSKAPAGSANVVQKGVSGAASQWKLQIGGRRGRAQCVVVGRGSKESYLVAGNVAVADGKWHDIACRRLGATLTVYVDGRDAGHRTIPAALSLDNTVPLRIGGPNLAAGSDMFTGVLDEVYARLG